LTPPAEAPQILALPSVAEGVLDGPLQLTAAVRGFPEPSYRWHHGGLSFSTSKSSLTLDRLSLADAGEWSLETENVHGRTTQNFTLTVRPAPWPLEAPQRRWSVQSGLALTDGAMVEAPLAITEAVMIDRLRVSVNLQHVETGDLTLTLIAPDGTAVSLMTPQRRLGWDLLGTTFADTAAMPLAETADPHPGSVQPAAPLSVLHGKSTAGAWKLRVADRLADGIGGTLISWAITTPTALGRVPHLD
jgi:subtilisin-like proprotein convertase family protein